MLTTLHFCCQDREDTDLIFYRRMGLQLGPMLTRWWRVQGVDDSSSAKA
jgi:hypothetical protein